MMKPWKSHSLVWVRGIAAVVSIFFLCADALSFSKDEEVVTLIKDRTATDGLPEEWRLLTFPKISRHTQYTFLHEEGRAVIHAESHQSASGLIHPLELDPQIYSILSWCWKINRIIEKGDETKKEGDDYAARIYVTFKYDPERATFWERTKYGTFKLLYGEYPPKAAINYVWAGRLLKGKDIANPYTEKARMVAIESGGEKIGQWVCEKRNLFHDYQKYFGGSPPIISGVAVMTDTDNTQEEATADYADLVLQTTR